MGRKTILSLLMVALSISNTFAQRILTMESAIELSLTGSSDLQKSAINLERYQSLLNAQRASYKSQFSLDVNPLEYQNSRNFDSRLSQWYTNETLSSSGTFSVEQPIVWTGTTLSLNNTFGWQLNDSQITGGEYTTDRAFSNSLYLSLSQPLFTYNELKMELKSIEMDYENALIDYALTRLSLEQTLTQQFYWVYMAQENLKISIEELENAEQNYDIIKEKVNLDIVPKSELYQAELNMSSAKSTVENDKVSLEELKDRLKQVLGLPLSEDIVVDTQISELSVYINPERAVENALSTRLELRQREITNKLSQYDLIKVKDEGKFKGSLGLSVGIMGDNSKFSNVYKNPTNNPSVMVSFSIPIFDWGARKSRIKAQELYIDMEHIDEKDELLEIEIDIRQTCRSLQNQMLQISIARKAIENAQYTYDLNVEKYRAGEITGMEMSEFQTQLSSSKLTLAQCLVDYKIELLNLKVISLYDFEKEAAISPLIMYSAETYEKYEDYKNKQNKK